MSINLEKFLQHYTIYVMEIVQYRDSIYLFLRKNVFALYNQLKLPYINERLTQVSPSSSCSRKLLDTNIFNFMLDRDAGFLRRTFLRVP